MVVMVNEIKIGAVAMLYSGKTVIRQEEAKKETWKGVKRKSVIPM